MIYIWIQKMTFFNFDIHERIHFHFKIRISYNEWYN